MTLKIDLAEIAQYADVERRLLKPRYENDPESVPAAVWVFIFGELARPERFSTARYMFGDELARIVCFRDPSRQPARASATASTPTPQDAAVTHNAPDALDRQPVAAATGTRRQPVAQPEPLNPSRQPVAAASGTRRQPSPTPTPSAQVQLSLFEVV